MKSALFQACCRIFLVGVHECSEGVFAGDLGAPHSSCSRHTLPSHCSSMSASDIHVLPPISTEIDGFPKTIHHDDSSVSQKTSPTVEGGLDGDRRFRDL